VRAGIKRLKSCDIAACDAYIECLNAEVDAHDNYERAEKVCTPKNAREDEFCQRVCSLEHEIPTYYFDSEEKAEPPPAIEDGPHLAKLCAADAGCPADYAEVAPYLGSFCAGTTTDASLEALAREVARGRIAKRTLSLVFNAYGAMHGYEFKRGKWMNGFFYGAGGAWLPAECRSRLKTVASAKAMPFYLTKLRDRVKQIWNQAR
jgi:hypothetical protein